MRKYLKALLRLVALIFIVSSCSAKDNNNISNSVTASQMPGLQVDNDGVVKLNGSQFKGVGVNYFSAFYRNIKNGADTTYKAGFRYLSGQHIPFIRFMACGFWPSDWQLYLTNKEEYFSRLDQFVRSAENIGIGLIPSLFWAYFTVPDIVMEPVNQWGNLNSKSVAFMKKYTEEVVIRYKDSPAIWGWEFGNEMNLTVDLPGLNNLPPIRVDLGCPATRSEADKISTKDMIILLEEFGKTIRKFDASRIIFSGNSIPRESAFHLYISKTWNNDYLSEFESTLDMQNPNPLNAISIHIYPTTKKRFADSPTTSLKEIIRISLQSAQKRGKPLFIGEFGTAIGPDERIKFNELLEGIEMYNIPISALWVFDYAPQNSDWNITPDNNRKYMLEEIGKLNVRFGIK